ncbi:17540_t:CDS:1 [Cetraspora pellucida]|uniref:17540_t:CDS:1 n=1 Tax=Cetraspora pellucida TaxID=1433469 RepID=A0ACA9NA05_9GLOM|nr:17540_t:CDS:1 [Cetraspora pellucida]
MYREIQKANELETRPQQKKRRYYSPDCSEDESDSEIAPISLTHIFREIFENSVKSQDKIVETESVTYLGKAVELEPNNLELGPKNLDDAAELGFNLNENVELEPEYLDHIAELGNKDLDATKLDTSSKLTEEVNDKKRKQKQYITCDLAKEVLDAYQTCVLPGEKLIYDGVNVLDVVYSTNEIKKCSLSIGVMNLYNINCTKCLPDGFKKNIAKQMQDPELRFVKFSSGKTIDKLYVNCGEEVSQYLDKFDNVTDVESLGECLDENSFSSSSASNDMIYVKNLLWHFYFLYKNDTLLQQMSEYEFNAHIWTPLLRNAFLTKTDIKLSYGELASNSYTKLKEMLSVAGNSSPKLDGKGFLRSLGTEILAQENGVLNTHGKRTGDLKKLEYCTKIILTVLYLALPTSVKHQITEIEAYSLQSSGFQLTISASKYLFENTIVTVDLQDIEVPRTVEGLSKLIKAIKIILSWKARTKKNTNTFYEVLKKGNERIKGGEIFTPKRIPIR